MSTDLPPTPEFPNIEEGSIYVGRKSEDPSFPYGVRLDVSWADPVNRFLGISYLETARRNGIQNLRVVPSETFEDVPTFCEQYPKLKGYFTTGIEKFTGRILIGDAFGVCGRNSEKIVDKSVALTSWEGGKIPRFVVEALGEFSEVWVPNGEVAQKFREVIQTPVHVVGPIVPRMRSPEKHEAFGFLILAVEALRDEALPVVRTFVETFTRKDPVCLYVATPTTSWPPLRTYLETLDKPDAPMVEPVALDWTNPYQFGHLLSYVDAVLEVDRCGGWDLASRVARANGIPAVFCHAIEQDLSGFMKAMSGRRLGQDWGDSQTERTMERRWAELGWKLP
jgi:hypothetical protein